MSGSILVGEPALVMHLTDGDLTMGSQLEQTALSGGQCQTDDLYEPFP